MNLKNIRDLVIAKEKYNYNTEISLELNYRKWVDYINNNLDYYTWAEDTIEGKKTLNEISKIPDAFRDRVLKGLNKMGCVADFNVEKGFYCMKVDYNDDNKKIWVSFECPPTIEQINHLISMAKNLDALLLKERQILIDEKVLEELSK